MSSTETEEIREDLQGLRTAVQQLAKLMGGRLTRAEVCERLGIHRNTLATYIASKEFPTPGRDGKWLLAEVLEWEAHK